MNKLQTLSLELDKIRETGQKRIPPVLKKQILQAIEESGTPLIEASDILKLHPMTLYKWKRNPVKNNTSKTRRRKNTVKNKIFNKHNSGKNHNDFVELVSTQISQAITPDKAIHSLFIEINLGQGAFLRVYR